MPSYAGVASFPEAWLKSELLKILGFEPDEIIQYLKSIDDPEEQRDYLVDMLDKNDPNHLNFIQDFAAKLNSSAKIAALAPPGMVAYKKSDDISLGSANGARPKSKLKNPPGFNKENSPLESKSESGKKGTKFVSLYAKDGNVNESNMILPGRNKCKCQAQKHDLINNCIKCGRVVCKQEGSGPCLFCGHLVCTKEEQEVLNRGSRKSDKLMEKLLSKSTEAQSKAELHKNTLLEYDKTSEKRTKVIDDESDYFATDTDKWQSTDERKKLKEREKEVWEQKHGSRLNKKYTFDFAGKTVVEAGLDIYDPSKDEKLQEILASHKTNQKFGLSNSSLLTKNGDFDDTLVAKPGVQRPTYVGLPDINSSNAIMKMDPIDDKHIMRIQDSQLQVMRDDGWCLTMHQPWASYLISGIKMHEGRTWYSPHRGRLWIHAAAKVPTEDEIKAVQASYSGVPRDFPKILPVSCLLGCVDVDDVLAQEEYREKYPNGESSAPFVFICINPQELMIKFPMAGKHKIYKMDPNIHSAAKKSAKKILGSQ